MSTFVCVKEAEMKEKQHAAAVYYVVIVILASPRLKMQF